MESQIVARWQGGCGDKKATKNPPKRVIWIDAYADAHHMTRSGFLAKAAETAMIIMRSGRVKIFMVKNPIQQPVKSA